MVTLRWSYYEIEDTDYTGVEIEIHEGSQLLECWSNFDRHESWKEVWGNQIEFFTMPTLDAARELIASARCYDRRSVQV